MSLKPGVVSGKDYLELIKACKEGGYALPAVNVVGTDSVNAVLEAAAKNNADVIIQLSNGGAEFYAGKGLIVSRPKSLALLPPQNMFTCWQNTTAYALSCTQTMQIRN